MLSVAIPSMEKFRGTKALFDGLSTVNTGAIRSTSCPNPISLSQEEIQKREINADRANNTFFIPHLVL